MSTVPTTSSMAEPKHTLQSLPAEMRDRIYAFAVTEDRPIIGRIAKRQTVAETDTRFRIDTKALVLPTLPNAALTCRQAYQEVSAVFYRENTLIFDAQEAKFEDWVAYLDRQEVIVQTKLQNLILQFDVYCVHTGKVDAFGYVEAKMASRSRLEVQFGGALATRCVCNLEKMVAVANDEGAGYFAGRAERYINACHENTLIDWACEFEDECARRLNRSSPSVYLPTANVECEQCGKLGADLIPDFIEEAY